MGHGTKLVQVRLGVARRICPPGSLMGAFAIPHRPVIDMELAHAVNVVDDKLDVNKQN